MHILPFTIGESRGAVPATMVKEVVRAAATLPLPSIPVAIEGLLDLHGQGVPVMDLRSRFGQQAKPTELTDKFIIVDAGELVLALHVDSVETVSSIDPGSVEKPRDGSLYGELAIAGVAALPDGMILLYDPALFFTEVEKEAIDSVLVARMQ